MRAAGITKAELPIRCGSSRARNSSRQYYLDKARVVVSDEWHQLTRIRLCVPFAIVSLVAVSLVINGRVWLARRRLSFVLLV